MERDEHSKNASEIFSVATATVVIAAVAILETKTLCDRTDIHDANEMPYNCIIIIFF